MRLTAFKKIGGSVVREEASVIIVESDSGVPIMVACETGVTGFECVAHAKDADFNRLLQSLGIDRLVVCESADKLLQPDHRLPIINPSR